MSATGLCVRKCSDSLRVFTSVHLLLNNNISDVGQSLQSHTALSEVISKQDKLLLLQQFNPGQAGPDCIDWCMQ